MKTTNELVYDAALSCLNVVLSVDEITDKGDFESIVIIPIKESGIFAHCKLTFEWEFDEDGEPKQHLYQDDKLTGGGE